MNPSKFFSIIPISASRAKIFPARTFPMLSGALNLFQSEDSRKLSESSVTLTCAKHLQVHPAPSLVRAKPADATVCISLRYMSRKKKEDATKSAGGTPRIAWLEAVRLSERMNTTVFLVNFRESLDNSCFVSLTRLFLNSYRLWEIRDKADGTACECTHLWYSRGTYYGTSSE